MSDPMPQIAKDLCEARACDGLPPPTSNPIQEKNGEKQVKL